MRSGTGFPQVQTWHPLGPTGSLSRLNDLFWWVIEDIFWPNPHQRTFHYLPIIIVCLIAVSLFFIHDWRRGMLWVLGMAVVLSPVLYPWSSTWILPLGCVAPRDRLAGLVDHPVRLLPILG